MTKVIRPSEGHYLTQVDEEISITDRMVATVIAIGKNDSPDNYKEITQEEADAIRQEQAAAREQEKSNDNND